MHKEELDSSLHPFGHHIISYPGRGLEERLTSKRRNSRTMKLGTRDQWRAELVPVLAYKWKPAC